jgi:hypothetical protein
MNTLAKRLGIVSSEIRLEAAARAMLDMMQSKFDLHPGKILKSVRGHVSTEEGGGTVEGNLAMIRKLVLAEAKNCFAYAKTIVEGTAIEGGYQMASKKFGAYIIDRFHLFPGDIAREAGDRSSSYQTTPIEFLSEYEAVLLEIIAISFEKAAELNEKK